MRSAAQMVDWRAGLISNDIFYDDEIYQRELERVFHKSWLFVAHESMIPRPGDFITNYMGQDPVIVTRDGANKIHVLVNKCVHRGNKVCLFDRGNARTFTCSYHGWTYTNDGALLSVPHYDEVYQGSLNKDDWGLMELPRVQNYGGLIFASADPDVMSLEDYLGDAKWYLDTFVNVEWLGGLQAIPGIQRYEASGNWKLLAENFHGDHYHFAITHASIMKVGREFAAQGLSMSGRGRPRGFAGGQRYELIVGFEQGVPHGFGGLAIGDDFYQQDIAIAEEMGAEAVEWVQERHRRLQEQLAGRPVKPYAFMRGNLFPNFSLMAFASPLMARTFILWQPRGSQQAEVWEWCLVEKEAPRIVKEYAINDLVHGQAAGGVVAPDDRENFERMADNLRSPLAKRKPFNYTIELGRELEWAREHAAEIEGLPGLVGADMNESNQRQLYRYWAELMDREPAIR